MANDRLQQLYEKAWKGNDTYTDDEQIRLIKACEVMRADARRRTLGRRYEVLDVGCGVGPLRRWLPVEQFCIHGTDLSEEAAGLARRQYDTCRVADVEGEWPHPPASLDAVHAGAVLEHVIDWHAPLNHANRVLRDGGLLVVSVPNLRYWKEIKRLALGRLPHWMAVMEHLHAYTPKFLTQLLALHGFQVESLEADLLNFPLLPSRSRWLTRWLGGFGSVIIVSARLRQRVRAEHDSRAAEFPHHSPAPLHSIVVHAPDRRAA